jgi:hypothetical protein
MNTPSVMVVFVGGWGAAPLDQNPFYEGSFSFLGDFISRYPSITLEGKSVSNLQQYYQIASGASDAQPSIVETLATHDVRQFFLSGPDRFGLLSEDFAQNSQALKIPGALNYEPFPNTESLSTIPDTVLPELLKQAEEKLRYSTDTAMYLAVDTIWSQLPYRQVGLVAESIQHVDKLLHKFFMRALEQGWRILIVSDGGGAENYINLDSQSIDTTRSANPLPCLLIAKELEGLRADEKDRANEVEFSLETSGGVNDIAPTLLSLFHIPQLPASAGTPLFPSCINQL